MAFSSGKIVRTGHNMVSQLFRLLDHTRFRAEFPMAHGRIFLRPIKTLSQSTARSHRSFVRPRNWQVAPVPCQRPGRQQRILLEPPASGPDAPRIAAAGAPADCRRKLHKKVATPAVDDEKSPVGQVPST